MKSKGCNTDWCKRLELKPEQSIVRRWREYTGPGNLWKAYLYRENIIIVIVVTEWSIYLLFQCTTEIQIILNQILTTQFVVLFLVYKTATFYFPTSLWQMGDKMKISRRHYLSFRYFRFFRFLLCLLCFRHTSCIDYWKCSLFNVSILLTRCKRKVYNLLLYYICRKI